MVLLFTRLQDNSADKVVKWLNHLGCSWKRVHSLNQISLEGNILTPHFNLYIDGEKIICDEIDAIYFNNSNFIYNIFDFEINEMNEQLGNKIKHEYYIALEYFFDQFKDVYILGLQPFKTRGVNKLSILKKAKECGLEIPNTYLVASKIYLSSILLKEDHIITKCIFEGNPLYLSSYIIDGQTTQELSYGIIDKLSDKFCISKVQNNVAKKYEIRVFYLDGICYSLAIFSQQNENAKIDFRNDIFDVRMVPYQLPESTIKKIEKFMTKIEINYGSLDFIFTESGDYIFLELNPYGQYGFVSDFGGYHLEKKIAEKLYEKKNK